MPVTRHTLGQKGDRGETGPCGPQGNPGMAEGDYTTWTIQSIYDTNVPTSDDDILGIRNNGEVLWHNFGAYTTYIISPAAALLATLDGKMGGTGYHRVSSCLDKYILYIYWSNTHKEDIVVQEGTAILWQRAVNDDRNGYTLDFTAPAPIPNSRLVAISPSGEWIAVMVQESGGNGLIFIYQGS